MIYIIDAETKELVYCKEKNYNIYYDSGFSESSRYIIERLNEKSIVMKERNFDWDLFSEIDNKWYTVNSMIMAWTSYEEVYFHMLFDISEQKVRQEQLEIAILKDPKTGIYNTNYAIELITSLFEHEDRFCVCFLDLDGLKYVNDTFGHSLGDKLIKMFIEVVLGEIRTNDSFCRIGGDEFLLITPNSEEHMALRIINRIQDAVDQKNAADTEKFEISFSYGIECSKDVTELTPKRIIDDADKKMYEQKRRKKNSFSRSHK
jgi:diguanylate cyclase (GGDEF)-like protein